ncbi:transcriptional repressor [Halopolyspora algeriensis]
MAPSTTSDSTSLRQGEPSFPDPGGQLRDVGLRATRPRIAVLRWLWDNPHSTAEAVAGAVRDELGSVSTQAIYDVLHACTAAGLLRRIEPAGHPARFETRIDDNHHHLVCRACGRAEDVDCVHGTAPCLAPSSTAGYVVDEAEVVFWGLCPDCRSAHTQDRSHHHEEGRS